MNRGGAPAAFALLEKLSLAQLERRVACNIDRGIRVSSELRAMLERRRREAAPATCSHCGRDGHAREACPWRFGGPNVNPISNPDGA
jgi:hypothetical protein